MITSPPSQEVNIILSYCDSYLTMYSYLSFVQICTYTCTIYFIFILLPAPYILYSHFYLYDIFYTNTCTILLPALIKGLPAPYILYVFLHLHYLLYITLILLPAEYIYIYTFPFTIYFILILSTALCLFNTYTFTCTIYFIITLTPLLCILYLYL